MVGIKEVAEKLNGSPWKGCITEVGVGLPFSSEYLNIPGASKTILNVNCPYKDTSRPSSVRAVSLENAMSLGEGNLEHANRLGSDGSSEFGLAITGAHYTDRPSHAWIYLATNDWEAYTHCFFRANLDRHLLGLEIQAVVSWFLEGCLFPQESWANRLSNCNSESCKIDVIYGPGIGDHERLMLLREDNPLAYRNGRFDRVVDVIRDFEFVFPGAFNPPTKAHLSQGNHNILFEISQAHAYKQNPSLEDLMHRVRMLDLEERATLITRAPRFVDKYAILSDHKDEVNFMLGADAWNHFVAGHQYPNDRWLAEKMPKSHFFILPRHGIEVDYAGPSKYLNYSVDDPRWEEGISSTKTREEGCYKHLTPKIAEYVRTRELYENS